MDMVRNMMSTRHFQNLFNMKIKTAVYPRSQQEATQEELTLMHDNEIANLINFQIILKHNHLFSRTIVDNLHNKQASQQQLINPSEYVLCSVKEAEIRFFLMESIFSLMKMGRGFLSLPRLIACNSFRGFSLPRYNKKCRTWFDLFIF